MFAHLRRWIFWLTVAVIVLATAVAVVTPHHPNVARPILALELAHTWAELSILLAIDRSPYWWNTRIDFAFLAAYTALFTLLAFQVARGHWRWALAGLALAAGLADLKENLAILRVLPRESFENEMAQAIRQWSLAKWGLLGVTWVALGVAQYRAWVPGALYAVAGALTLWGCLDHRWIEIAMGPLAVALLWQLYAYWPWRRAASWRSRATASGSSVG